MEEYNKNTFDPMDWYFDPNTLYSGKFIFVTLFKGTHEDTVFSLAEYFEEKAQKEEPIPLTGMSFKLLINEVDILSNKNLSTGITTYKIQVWGKLV